MMLPGNIASTYKLPEPQKQVAKLDVTSLLGCKESLQLLLELLGCIAHNRHSQTYSQHCASSSYIGTMPLLAADVQIDYCWQLLHYCRQLCWLQNCILAGRSYHGSPRRPLLLCAFWHLPLVFQPLASQLLHISASILLPEPIKVIEPHVCAAIMCSIQGCRTHNQQAARTTICTVGTQVCCITCRSKSLVSASRVPMRPSMSPLPCSVCKAFLMPNAMLLSYSVCINSTSRNLLIDSYALSASKAQLDHRSRHGLLQL